MNNFRNLIISSTEICSRRIKLVENLMKKCGNKNHLIVLPSSDVQYQTRHIPRPYHQDPYFYYYSGFLEKKAVLLIKVTNGNLFSSLYIHQPTKEETLWNGSYPNEEEALAVSGVDEIGFGNDWIRRVEQILKEKDSSCLWVTDSNNCTITNSQLLSVAKNVERKDISPLIDLQRVVKSPSEIAIMKESARITSRALKSAMAYTRANINEHELLGKLTLDLSRDGAKLAYPPVIAGGDRSNTIHYLEGTRDVLDGDLVLVDVGADVLGYYSDVTRTWPVSGRFTGPQAVLYDVLCEVYRDCLTACTAGRSLDDLLRLMRGRMGAYLLEAGVLRRPQDVAAVCPHHIGHQLGLDIHDCPTVPSSTPLATGMVFPLEPGIYFPASCKSVDAAFRGIGMRLEDDLVMREDGLPEYLDPHLPRSRADIERLCAVSLAEDSGR